MDAISKKSGKRFTGKLAALMLRIGAAAPADGSEYVKPKKVIPKKKAKAKTPKPKAPKAPGEVKPKVKK